MSFNLHGYVWSTLLKPKSVINLLPGTKHFILLYADDTQPLLFIQDIPYFPLTF